MSHPYPVTKEEYRRLKKLAASEFDVSKYAERALEIVEVDEEAAADS